LKPELTGRDLARNSPESFLNVLSVKGKRVALWISATNQYMTMVVRGVIMRNSDISKPETRVFIDYVHQPLNVLTQINPFCLLGADNKTIETLIAFVLPIIQGFRYINVIYVVIKTKASFVFPLGACT